MNDTTKKAPAGVSAGGLKDLFNKSHAFGDENVRRILRVPVEDVVSKNQVRKHFHDIDELAASMKAEGQLSPVIVDPKNEEGKYVIQKGERRWRAIKLAGISHIDIDISEKYTSTVDGIAGELIENIQRDALKPIEIADALNVFVKENWKQKDIAARIGKTTKYVSTHLSLLELPECVRQLSDNNVTHDVDTLNAMRMVYDVDPQQCETYCAESIKEGKISRADSRKLLAKVKSNKRADKLPENTNSSQKPADNWVEGEGRVAIMVNILKERNVAKGILCLDRVADDTTKAWVTLEGETGAGKLELVNVDALEVTGVCKI